MEAPVGKSGQAGDIFLSLCFKVGRAGSVCLDIAVYGIRISNRITIDEKLSYKIGKHYLENNVSVSAGGFYPLSLVKTTQLDKSANPAPGSGSVQQL